jgi:repressor of nif and glnA expression
VPTCALDRVRKVLAALEEADIGRALLVGKPGQPLLGVPVQEGRTGFIVPGGLNPLAAVEEAGIATRNAALSHMVAFHRLQHYRDLADELGIATG